MAKVWRGNHWANDGAAEETAAPAAEAPAEVTKDEAAPRAGSGADDSAPAEKSQE